MIFFKVAIVLRTKMVMFINSKNSKVFEQKGDLLNFKANIDSMAFGNCNECLSSATPWLSLAQLGSAWLSLTQLGSAQFGSAWPSLTQLSLA